MYKKRLSSDLSGIVYEGVGVLRICALEKKVCRIDFVEILRKKSLPEAGDIWAYK